MISKINWKLVGLFCLKLFLYLLVIPISASIFQTIAFSIALPLLFKVKHITGGTSIGLQIWAILAVVIYSALFYVYVLINRYIKSKRRRRWMLFLFIFIPALFGGGQFTMAFYWAILGNLIYNGYYYAMYYVAEYFLPSFRGQLK
ncbi:hypothetical protein [Aquirufa lenticrescens]|uniref:hypothetical protein n=1 Tax=Aquirufa lenticrescens TaxID=2696560 RepID=UPI001CAA5590|nr:hypothetical protein [Aquirufa lenticrescens]UAJ14357.1 hypothetical protein G9X62_07200 [Aquirufa lenticrescens]